MGKGNVFFADEIKGLRVYTRKPTDTYKSKNNSEESYSESGIDNSSINPIFYNNLGNGFLRSLFLE